ncbi:MAG TPA: hypothetical protein VGB70_05360 [Allosphingosinicella sp.]|jgi:hypothetical protein
MRKVFLIAGVAALAASMPTLAEKGGKGGGNGGGKGPAAQVQGGGGNKAARGGGGGQAQLRAAKPQKAERQAVRGGNKPAKADRQALVGGGKPAKAERQAYRAAKPQKADRKFVQQAAKGDARVQRDFARDGYRDLRRDVGAFAAAGAGYAAVASQGCPPGLAKKGNGCLPHGQARKIYGVGERVEQSWFGDYNIPARYSAFYADSPEYYYRYDDDGYIYRVDRQTDLISSLVPLLGGGFSVGQALPAGYDVYNVPYQYRDDFYDTDEAYYRYGDDAIYEVDPQSGMIESIVALLAGDLNVGQALPSGYDAYNLPLEYRDDYQDSDDFQYRYADGNIYQVDAKTQMIQAIVEMLV